MMRSAQWAWWGFAAFALAAAPAWAQSDPRSIVSRLQDDVEIVPQVIPGDQIGIACTALTRSNADSDVRVVLTIAAEPGETPPGYKKVLATDEQIAHGAVRVRIPSVPDLADHVVNVDVYVVGDKGGAESCDAGHMKIMHQIVAGAPGGSPAS